MSDKPTHVRLHFSDRTLWHLNHELAFFILSFAP